MKSIIILHLLLACVSVVPVLSECPDAQAILPCTGCSDNYIECAGNEYVDLNRIFHTLSTTSTASQKQYKYFHFSNTNITTIPDNVFLDITFDEITIEGSNVKTINSTTAMATHGVTKSLTLKNNFYLGAQSFMDILRPFVRLEYFTEINTYYYPQSFRDVTEDTFGSVYLKEIHLVTPDKVQPFAFRRMRDLTLIEFNNTFVMTIYENAFTFDEPRDQALEIRIKFSNDPSGIYSFKGGSLSDIKRPTKMYIRGFKGDSIYLPEHVFGPFFRSDSRNNIVFLNTSIQCDNCRSVWLKHQALESRMANLKCRDGSKFDDTSNFRGCVDFGKLPCAGVVGEYVKCTGSKDIDMSAMFDTLSKTGIKEQTDYKLFYMNNTGVTAIPDNVFRDITFSEITIDGTNVRTINTTTPMKTHDWTYTVTIANNPHLTQESILGFMNAFTDRVYGMTESNNALFLSVPDRGFSDKNFKQKLKQIRLMSPTTIGANAFTDMANILSMDFGNVEHIHPNAFRSSYLRQIFIDFSRNKLTAESFEPHSLPYYGPNTYTSISVNLTGGGAQAIKYLNEDAFRAFFSVGKDNYNRIDLMNNPFDCSDCRSYWIKEGGFQRKIANIQCSDGKPFDDPTHFSACSKYSTFPCYRREPDYINCTGSEPLDLVQVFENLKYSSSSQQKHYKSFVLSNSNVTSIPDNVFQDFTFDEIIIDGTKLVTIDSTTPMATHRVTKNIVVTNNPNLTQESILNFMKNFLSVENITDYKNPLFSEIPAEAFTNYQGYQRQLKEVRFNMKQSIGSHAFRHMSSVELIRIKDNEIQNIASNAFTIDEPATNTLVIDLSGSIISGKSFSPGSFNDTRRPTMINLSGDRDHQVPYLLDHTFLPFFIADPKNSIDMRDNWFDCQDCRSYWLKVKGLGSRITNLKCNTGHPANFSDPKLFANCFE